MGEVLFAFGLITCAAIVLVIFFMFFRYFGLCMWTATWIFSSKEEKMNLTEERGLFSSNGYFIPSESLGDINLCYTGSFKRFENVDHDPGIFPATLPIEKPSGYPQDISLPYGTIQTTDLSVADELNYIPPQPLRVAPELPIKKVPPKRPPPPIFTRNRGGSLENEELLPEGVQRALSCESVTSETSVEPADLKEPHITGVLCIGIDYDSECGDLSVNILEARDLVSEYLNPDGTKLLDTFARVFLMPDQACSVQTRLYKSSNSPSYQEKFLFGIEACEFSKRSLLFHVYSWDNSMCTLIGEGELKLAELPSRKDLTTWVSLTDTEQGTDAWGEILISLNYLPTAERLTVVIAKARNLVFENGQDSGDPFVKVYLLKDGKKISKKKTSVKKRERNPVFNEAMIFNVPCYNLEVVQVRITASEMTEAGNVSLGHVIIGKLGIPIGTKSLAHWQQMLATPRKPITMWHSLRK